MLNSDINPLEIPFDSPPKEKKTIKHSNKIRTKFLSLNSKRLISSAGYNITPIIKDLRFLFGVVLAGGSLRCLFDKTETINDIDLFFIGGSKWAEETYEKTKEYYLSRGWKVSFECPEEKLCTLKRIGLPKIQLIKDEEYNNVYDILNSFDFNACRFAIYNNVLYYSRAGINDIKKKKLSLYRLTYPTATIKRVMKYKEKGYQVNDCLVEIVKTLTNREFIFEDDKLERIYID